MKPAKLEVFCLNETPVLRRAGGAPSLAPGCALVSVCVSGGQACSTFRALRVVFARRSFVFAFDNEPSFRLLSCAVRTYHVYAHCLA